MTEFIGFDEDEIKFIERTFSCYTHGKGSTEDHCPGSCDKDIGGAKHFFQDDQCSFCGVMRFDKFLNLKEMSTKQLEILEAQLLMAEAEEFLGPFTLDKPRRRRITWEYYVVTWQIINTIFAVVYTIREGLLLWAIPHMIFAGVLVLLITGFSLRKRNRLSLEEE